MENTRRVKLACYFTNMSMSVVANLSPILFLTFRQLYGLSYSLLGLLVLVNFCTQLTVDLIFSFFSHKFNIERAVKITPVLTLVGLLIFALAPTLFGPYVFLGLILGTVIFSASGGFSEVLISPVIAAIPSDDPDREMSKLHSVYAWGVVGVVIIGTLFLMVFGPKNWQWLAILFLVVPLTAVILFFGAKLPKMETPEKVSGAFKLLKNRGVWLLIAAIFFGGAAECTMAQWSSGYLERALGIEKVWGDIFGVAMFSVMLGLGRSLYAKFGKNTTKVIFWGALGATICYFTAAVSSSPLVGLLACALTGFCTSMLWPGNLIVASERFPLGGVFIYAMMAAGGDLGASAGPQLVGVVTDAVINSQKFLELGQSIGISTEQLGMKMGMLVGMVFPLAGLPIYRRLLKEKKEK